MLRDAPFDQKENDLVNPLWFFVPYMVHNYYGRFVGCTIKVERIGKGI